MFKQLFFAAMVLLSYISASAQKKDSVTLSFTPSGETIQPFYDHVRVIDSREHRENLGFVHPGIGNKNVPVVPSGTLENQFQNYFNSLGSSKTPQGELVIQVRSLNFSEAVTATSEQGFINVRLSFYCFRDNHYTPISTLDSSLGMSAGMDVTKRLLRTSTEIIKEAIKDNASRQPMGASLTFAEVSNIDSVEESQTLLYTSEKLTDGLYETFDEFKSQKPAYPIEEVTKGEDTLFYILLPNGKKERMRRFDFTYSIVSNGKPYKVTGRRSLCPMEKSGNDFFCIANLQDSPNPGDALFYGILFGAVGYAIATAEAVHTYKVKIDHLTGRYIPVQRLD
jgi:hypothetical protein